MLIFRGRGARGRRRVETAWLACALVTGSPTAAAAAATWRVRLLTVFNALSLSLSLFLSLQCASSTVAVALECGGPGAINYPELAPLARCVAPLPISRPPRERTHYTHTHTHTLIIWYIYKHLQTHTRVMRTSHENDTINIIPYEPAVPAREGRKSIFSEKPRKTRCVMTISRILR